MKFAVIQYLERNIESQHLNSFGQFLFNMVNIERLLKEPVLRNILYLKTGMFFYTFRGLKNCGKNLKLNSHLNQMKILTR
jgi:hypothetical protein